MAKSTGDKELDRIYKELRDNNISSNSSHNSYRSESSTDGDLLRFFVGLVMLAGGLYMILQNINVTSSWGFYSYHIGSFHFSNGLILLPSIIGIGMLFLMDRKIFGWIVLAIGIAIILLSVFLTTNVYWKSTSAYTFIIMFGLTAAGAAMVLKELFRKR